MRQVSFIFKSFFAFMPSVTFETLEKYLNWKMNEEEPQVADAVENFENDSVDQSDETTSTKSKKDPLAGLRTWGKKISKNSKALAKKMHEGIERIKTRAASPNGTPNSRSRTSSRASSLNRNNKKLQNMKEVFDNFGKRLSLGRGQTPNFDDVFNDGKFDGFDEFWQLNC